MSILFRVQPEHTRALGGGEPTGWVGGCWKCEFAPLYELFPSFFFVLIGASVDLDALVGASTLLLLAGMVALSFAVKYLACWLPPGHSVGALPESSG